MVDILVAEADLAEEGTGGAVQGVRAGHPTTLGALDQPRAHGPRRKLPPVDVAEFQIEKIEMSVLTAPERSYNGRINAIIAKYVPSLAAATARTFSLGDEARLRGLLSKAGFVDVAVLTKSHSFELPSFDAYYGPFERGGGSTGQALHSLPEHIRAAVREAMRRSLGDDGGPVKIDVEFMIASGR